MSPTKINQSLLFLLILTIISSALAFHIVVRAYDNVFEEGYIGE